MEDFGCASSTYCVKYGVLVFFWRPDWDKPLYSIGIFRWFNERLALSPVFNQAGIGKKNASVKSRKLFGGIGFGRIYKNRRDFDAVFGDCILGPGRISGPFAGDLCACP